MATFSPSPLDRFVQRTRLPWGWFVIIVGIVLFSLPILVAYIEGIMDEFLHEGAWRSMMQGPAIILYILILIQPMNRSMERAVKSLRPVINIDDAAFNKLVNETTDINPPVPMG